MKEKIRRHLEELFSEAPKTRKAIELKEELTQNALEKYEDLVGEGYREEDAFQNVIGSIGDVSELFEVLEEKNLLSLSTEDRRKKALLTAVSVGLYVFAGAVFLFFNVIASFVGWYGSFDYATLGLLLAVIICIAPTGMLVYANHMYPTFRKEENSLVEDYKEARHSANRKKAIRRSITLLIWTVTLTLYFIISFATWKWESTWIIFLIGCCIQALTLLILNLRSQS